MNRVSLEEARRLMQSHVVPLTGGWGPVATAHGHYLAQDVYAPAPLPSFPRAPMAGYALRALDVLEATAENPIALQVMTALTPGALYPAGLQPGQAVKLAAGAMFPAGADCLLPWQEAVQEGDTLLVSRSLRLMERYCPVGSAYQTGQLLLPAGTRLDSWAIGFLAGAGVDTVPITRKPRVLLITTGDGLVVPGIQSPARGRVYDSVGIMLKTRLEELGVECCNVRKLSDDEGLIAEVMFIDAEHNDVVITTGGVSPGGSEVMPIVLRRRFAKPVFEGLDVAPCESAIFSTMYQKPILSLPGDPAAAALSFELLARPLLSALSAEPMDTVAEMLPLAADCSDRIPRGRFLGAVLTGGRVTAVIPMGLSSLAGCNCLVKLPVGDAPLCAGTPVEVLRL